MSSMSALTKSGTGTRRKRRRPRPLRSPRRASSRLVEVALEVGDALGDEAVGNAVLDRSGEDRLGGGNGGVRGGGAHIGQRLRFGLSNLALRHLGAPCDKVFDLGRGFRSQPL